MTFSANGAPFSRIMPTKAGPTAMTIDDKTRTELEAAAFRRLVGHLRSRTDVQNIEAIYGMPYETWKSKFQGSASPEQLEAMKKAHSGH